MHLSSNDRQEYFFFYTLEFNPSWKEKLKDDDPNKWEYHISPLKQTLEEAKNALREHMYYKYQDTMWGLNTKKVHIKKNIRNIKFYVMPATIVEEGEPK